MEYKKKNVEKNMFSTNRITDKISNTNGLSPFKSSKELENNYKTMPLRLIDKIINELNFLESSRELKNNYKTMPLRLTDGITDELNPSKISRELKKLQDHATKTYKQNCKD
jgi:hypothetical protein